jgi:biotin synthase
MVGVVREVIDPKMPLLVNTGDLSLEQCKQLKAAGVDGMYHAVRMGEGVTTGIPVEKRLATLENIAKSGMKLATCVEPIGPEHTAEELVEKTFYCIDAKPLLAGAGRRVTVPGTKSEPFGQLDNTYNALYVAVYRLASGLEPYLNCSGHSQLTAYAGANIAWTEMGVNPRDTMRRTERGGHSVTTAVAQKVFREAGWDINPSWSIGWQ